jgi:hypothetical protein
MQHPRPRLILLDLTSGWEKTYAVRARAGPGLTPFWFDPLCPWAWITSRWLLEVEQVRPARADWRIMSLAYLNLIQRHGEGLSENYLELMRRAWGPVRVCAAAAECHVLGPLYTAIGTRLHNQRRREDPAVIAEALAEAGPPGSLATAATSTDFDQLIKVSHDEAFDEVGLDVGTPEAAGQLWDGLVMIAKADGFFELKRRRDRKPSFD